MSNGAGRKKSIVSSTGLQIDNPVAHNTLLNKAASQSTSLYQQCSSLRSRLMRIRGFSPFFALSSDANSRQSTDPVTQLWDLFSLGTPLCFIFNLLEGVTPINVDTDPMLVETSNEKAMKRAIALFAMQIRQVAECEPFTVTDLWDRNSTDGLVKVINTVTTIVDQLPEDEFEEHLLSSPTLPSQESNDSFASDTPSATPANAQEAARNNIVREMVETERKYVQDLETMQKYANSISQANVMNQDTIHLLFPGLNKLLNFQRKFLIRLESTAELPWQDQRWGLHFIENEEEFIVYEPYCANYTAATELLMANAESLMTLSHLINARSELPAFLIKPVQRICKYPLLLDSLIKASSPANYQHFEELKAGSAAAKRITDKINEAQRRAENEQTVKNLHSRIEDWKGHHLSNFGELLLDDIFVVTKSEVDREYHVFLFEKIILCCKEALQQPPTSGRKVGKSNSILKKQSTPGPLSLPGAFGPTKKKDTPLLLKGRIFLNNVTQAVPSSPRYSTGSAIASHHALAVWWRGDDDLEFFTLRCRTEEQMKQWENQLNRLIKEAAIRRASDRNMSKLVSQMNSANPAAFRQPSTSYAHDKTFSLASQSPYLNAPPQIALNSRSRRPITPHDSDEQMAYSNGNNTVNGAQRYPHDGFDVDDDEYEDFVPVDSCPPSGRGTPVGTRRNDLESNVRYDRSRSQIDDPHAAQWRGHGLPPPPSALGGFPAAPTRPITPHLSSNMSASSYASEASFGNGMRQRPPLRSQFSSTKMNSVYSNADPRSTTPSNTNTSALPPPNRSRSASQPSSYVPNKAIPPPLPTSMPWIHRSNTSMGANKRGSGSSQSTGDSSDYSPNSSSPITPFGSSESSLGGVGLRPARSQTFENVTNASTHYGPPVKVKVHFHEDIFVIQVPRTTEYIDLVEKVGRKIRLCGPRRDDGPLRVKYRDEDGDMVSLGSTEDVQMAFEQYRPGGQVTLFVT